MDQIGNYRILHKLGEGGMGEVFKGIDTMLEREVAIKMLRPELSRREDILQRFRSEAVALGRLNHPNIATVYAFSRDGDQYYMALEFVNGEALDKLIARRGRLPWPDAVRYACGALEGLEHAHHLNVIHRDVKPANILISHSGVVKLMDFGIARILERARQTRQGYLVGTLGYMSPEQIRGFDVDARSDIYSLGMVLYQMLAGRLPFQHNSDYEILKSQIEELPTPPRTFAPNIPRALENLVLRALAKKPADRFASALEFRDALSEAAGIAPTVVDATGETRLPVPDRPGRRGFPVHIIPRYGTRSGLARYSAPALAAVLGAAGLAVLWHQKSSWIDETVQSPPTPIVQPTPTPPIVREEKPVAHAPVLPSPVAPTLAPAQPVNVSPAATLPEQRRRMEVPPGIREFAPPPEEQDASTPDTTHRKRTSPASSAKPRSAVARPADIQPRRASRPTRAEDDPEYWQNLNRSFSASDQADSRPRAASRSRQGVNDDADYWRDIDRKTSRFLKRR